MGTRADFYVGRGQKAEWLGSIAWDGSPIGIPGYIRKVITEKKFRESVIEFIWSRQDGTLPEQGWPWPWDDSRTTDYAYAFADGQVYASCFGHEWFDANSSDEPEYSEDAQKVSFPDMTKVQNINFGKRSGLLVIRPKD